MPRNIESALRWLKERRVELLFGKGGMSLCWLNSQGKRQGGLVPYDNGIVKDIMDMVSIIQEAELEGRYLCYSIKETERETKNETETD